MMTKCLTCVSEYIQAKQEGKEPSEWPEVRPADTWVPVWQEKIIGPGMLATACLALPCCIDHITVEKKSALDLSGAVALGGSG